MPRTAVALTRKLHEPNENMVKNKIVSSECSEMLPILGLETKMLSTTCECYLPLHSHSLYVICHT